MPSKPSKPDLYCRQGGVFSLSGPGLQEFLKAVLAKGACFRFRARGCSMYPFIQDGDVITISPLRGRPRPGEVVAFCHPGTQRLMIHRVLARVPGGYLIRGDSALSDDGFIPQKDVFGTVSLVERQTEQVCLGLGPEGHLIAWLSQYNLLQILVQRTVKIFHLVLKMVPK